MASKDSRKGKTWSLECAAAEWIAIFVVYRRIRRFGEQGIELDARNPHSRGLLQRQDDTLLGCFLLRRASGRL
jgi:hypothetical protein